MKRKVRCEHVLFIETPDAINLVQCARRARYTYLWPLDMRDLMLPVYVPASREVGAHLRVLCCARHGEGALRMATQLKIGQQPLQLEPLDEREWAKC